MVCLTHHAPSEVLNTNHPGIAAHAITGAAVRSSTGCITQRSSEIINAGPCELFDERNHATGYSPPTSIAVRNSPLRSISRHVTAASPLTTSLREQFTTSWRWITDIDRTRKPREIIESATRRCTKYGEPNLSYAFITSCASGSIVVVSRD